jgi:hypothetical protein
LNGAVCEHAVHIEQEGIDTGKEFLIGLGGHGTRGDRCG